MQLLLMTQRALVCSSSWLCVKAAQPLKRRVSQPQGEIRWAPHRREADPAGVFRGSRAGGAAAARV